MKKNVVAVNGLNSNKMLENMKEYIENGLFLRYGNVIIHSRKIEVAAGNIHRKERMAFMKSILCYGDSNTYGYIPGGIGRYPREVRWTGLLQQKLGEEYYVIEEGLNARTTVWDDPIEDVMSGKTYLVPCLRTHRPLDGVILMLGTNNLKNRFFTSADDIARSIGTLVELIQKVLGEIQEIEPKILVVSPIEVGETIVDTEDGILFSGEEGIQASKDFAKLYKQQAERHCCDFLSAAEFASPSPVDCIHLNEAGHAALAEALYQKVRSMFEDK